MEVTHGGHPSTRAHTVRVCLGDTWRKCACVTHGASHLYVCIFSACVLVCVCACVTHGGSHSCINIYSGCVRAWHTEEMICIYIYVYIYSACVFVCVCVCVTPGGSHFYTYIYSGCVLVCARA